MYFRLFDGILYIIYEIPLPNDCIFCFPFDRSISSGASPIRHRRHRPSTAKILDNLGDLERFFILGLVRVPPKRLPGQLLLQRPLRARRRALHPQPAGRVLHFPVHVSQPVPRLQSLFFPATVLSRL